MHCGACRWEFLVLDLPVSAPLIVMSNLFIHSLPVLQARRSEEFSARIIFVVCAPGVACLLPSMTVFATLKRPVFVLNVNSVDVPEESSLFVHHLVRAQVFSVLVFPAAFCMPVRSILPTRLFPPLQVSDSTCCSQVMLLVQLHPHPRPQSRSGLASPTPASSAPLASGCHPFST